MSSRRMFLKKSALAVGGILAAGEGSTRETRAVALQARDIQDDVERYQATVPDTLDLAERCRLALNGIAGTSDPDMYGQQWFSTSWAVKTPYLSHNASDATCTPKFAESFPLLRWASGSKEYMDLERYQMENLVGNIYDKDGLYYSVWKPDRPWHAAYLYDERSRQDFAWVGGVGRMMRAMMARRQCDGDTQWDDRIRKMARGLGKIAIFKKDYAYYPDAGHGVQFAHPKSGWRHTREPQGDVESREGSVVDSIGHTAYALSRWYRMSGDEEALELARNITRFMMLPKMWGGLVEEISVNGAEQGHFHTHPHGRMVGLRGILETGWAAQDSRTLEFVRRSYEGLRRYMIPRIGWFPSNGVGESGFAMEACSLGDLCALGTRLSDLRLGDYWEDVDALVRNMMMEQQLTNVEKLREVSRHASGGGPSSPMPKRETTDRMPDRIVGLFSSFSLSNSLPPSGIMGCCSGNSTQGLYFAWEGALRCEQDTVTINLLVNRASPLADVDSYIPYQGKVVIHNKAARRCFIRILSWIDNRQLKVNVSGQPRPQLWAGNFLMVDAIKPGDDITLEFPIPESRATYTAHHRVWRKEKKVTYTFLGSTVVDVEPKEENPMHIPIFHRPHLGPASKIEVQRVVHHRPNLGW